ncbi:MAG: ATP-binding cassette domain-containing protein, partial [Clostridia bacterium]|nr:ATP-binding cassette domain-containing protein [Clostridia bacterium]
MIEVKNVTKKFDNFIAIDGLSFTVDKGSIYGLVGYNGAGKTTLLKTIAGVYKADGGEVLIDGVNTYDSTTERQRMFYVPDDIYFEPYSTIAKMSEFYKGYYPSFSDETLDKLCGVFSLDK